ncbi:MAG: hypothetical protein LBV59_09850 [Sphingobacterium sp.]|jgi:hypothetical protein|uniref:hypothetical protein n=1 Tax=Sphingobacterium sp. TaxID=341027 RepID=UPI002840A1FC|nr:hypothetical protein [Sphingobacterium sp.]MDR3008225.1 hypothetical protein [Sphingobacterium sp.]
MKKVKLFVPILGAILGLGVYVGHANEISKKATSTTEQSWEVINPSGDLTNPNNYQPYSGDIATLCPSDEVLCGIKAENDGTGKPQMTNELKSEINSGTPTSHVFYRAEN